jgi:hypothetical protein
MGLIFGENSYLRDGWNILDFTIVLSTLVPIFAGGSAASNLQSLRSFRILRPLRTISTIKELKVLLETLFSSLPYLLNTLIILVFFIIVFAIAAL